MDEKRRLQELLLKKRKYQDGGLADLPISPAIPEDLNEEIIRKEQEIVASPYMEESPEELTPITDEVSTQTAAPEYSDDLPEVLGKYNKRKEIEDRYKKDLEEAKTLDALNMMANSIARFGTADIGPGQQTQFAKDVMGRRDAEMKQFEPIRLGKKIVQMNPETGEYDVLADASETGKSGELSLSNNPSDPQSKAARDAYKAAGYKGITDDLSAFDLSQMFDKIDLKKEKKVDFKAPGIEKYEESMGKRLVGYDEAGGGKVVINSINEIENSLNRIENDPKIKNAFGGVLQKGIDLFGADGIRKIVSPEMAEVLQNIQKNIQEGLRKTLGAQFTEKEGKMFLERGFDPALSLKENIRRVKKILSDATASYEKLETSKKLLDKYGAVSSYELKRRGLSPEKIEKYRVKYKPTKEIAPKKELKKPTPEQIKKYMEINNVDETNAQKVLIKRLNR